MRPPTQRPRRPGFTLVEMMVVIVIIGILAGLLIPAIGGAVRTARNAAVIAEINQLSNALAQFKSKYGDYPPSRIYLSENGNFAPPNGATADLKNVCQRSASYLRRFFPQFQLSTTGPLYTAATGWPDFNGNGTLDAAYVLQGHECLVFFLGGIPKQVPGGFNLTGFAKNPTNPFDSVSQNRNAPFFEFVANRLWLDPTRSNAATNIIGYTNAAGITNYSGIPGYLDSLANPRYPFPSGENHFFTYFSAYGNNNYDPNDVNFPEQDVLGLGANVALNYTGVVGASPAPNPYTVTLTTAGTLAYQKPNSFQIISSGSDGLYGPGGQYNAQGTPSTSYDPANPYTPAGTVPNPNNGIRQPERDNLTNFNTSKLD